MSYSESTTLLGNTEEGSNSGIGCRGTCPIHRYLHSYIKIQLILFQENAPELEYLDPRWYFILPLGGIDSSNSLFKHNYEGKYLFIIK